MKVKLESSKELGATLRKLRQECGKTLSQVAKDSGISKSYLSQIERGGVRNPTVELLGRIAKALGVDLVIQGARERNPLGSLAYESPFTLGVSEEHLDEKTAVVKLVAEALEDPKIPDSYKRLLAKQIEALVKAVREETQHATEPGRAD